MKKRTERELLKVINQAEGELSKLRNARREKENAEFVGRHFKYRNSYGDDEASWWLYESVIDTRGPLLVVWQFETDCYGKIAIEPQEETSVVPREGSGYIEIPPSEFEAAWDKLLAELNQL